jgi:hypothetical protein
VCFICLFLSFSLIRQFQSLEASETEVSSAWKESARRIPSLGTPGKFRPACSVASVLPERNPLRNNSLYSKSYNCLSHKRLPGGLLRQSERRAAFAASSLVILVRAHVATFAVFRLQRDSDGSWVDLTACSTLGFLIVSFRTISFLQGTR